jgi:hypothetical protein
MSLAVSININMADEIERKRLQNFFLSLSKRVNDPSL